MDLMAEKYGEIPKLFTVKWWGYFWEYYKLHTIIIAVILLLAGSTVYSVVTAPKYDFNVSYAGEYDLIDKNAEILRKRLSEFVTDTDGDGKDGVALNRISFVDGMEDPQLEYALIVRMQLEFTDNNSILFIFDDTKAPYYIGVPETDGAFLEVSQWLDGEVSDDRLYMLDEKAYALSLKGSKLLEECGIKSDNLYIAVRNYKQEPDEELKEKIADAKNIANAIVK